jgi:hypothetical protein
MKDIILIDQNELVPYEGPMTRLPSRARRTYGCLQCDWKEKGLCRYKYKAGKGNKIRENMHSNGICQARTNHLKSYYTGNKKTPTYTEWQLDYNNAQAQNKHNETQEKLKAVEKELNEMRKQLRIQENLTDSDKLQLKILRDMNRQYQLEWFELNKDLRRQGLERHKLDEGTKVNITKLEIKPSDVGQLIKQANEEVVEAEYKEVKNESRKKEDE